MIKFNKSLNYNMESNNKKPVFEPISPEEAKKIRAYDNTRENPPSGLECLSGWGSMYDPCIGKGEDDWCCYHSGFSEIHGKCRMSSSGTEGIRLICVTNGTPPWG